MKSGKQTDWQGLFQKLISKHEKRRHPLTYKSWYELVVKIVLAAQSTDDRVNQVSVELFKAYPSIRTMAAAKPEDLYQYISSIRGFMKKSRWIVQICQELQQHTDPPLNIKELTKLPGIGRKTANFIIGELGGKMEGIVVDLHAARIGQRLGFSKTGKPEEVENKIMKLVPQENWRDVGLSMTFLGRETCRPTDPSCPECIFMDACQYHLKSDNIK